MRRSLARIDKRLLEVGSRTIQASSTLAELSSTFGELCDLGVFLISTPAQPRKHRPSLPVFLTVITKKRRHQKVRPTRRGCSAATADDID